MNNSRMFFLPFSTARFRLPVTVLTRYETLVETVYSSFESGIFDESDFGEATRFDFVDPEARGSIDLGSLLGSLEGSLFGSEAGSALAGSLLGSEDGSLAGSDFGSLAGSDFGSLAGSAAAGSLLGSLEGSGAVPLAGSGSTSKPGSCNTGKFLHSAVNFFGRHPKPTQEVPFTTSAISISFCSFKIRQ